MGKVLEFSPYTLIKYSLFAPRPGLEDEPENYFIMSYILNDNGDSTELIIEQDDNRPKTSNQESYEDDDNSILLGLKELVEAQ